MITHVHEYFYFPLCEVKFGTPRTYREDKKKRRLNRAKFGRGPTDRKVFNLIKLPTLNIVKLDYSFQL